jgi:hypothetical protein
MKKTIYLSLLVCLSLAIAGVSYTPAFAQKAASEKTKKDKPIKPPKQLTATRWILQYTLRDKNFAFNTEYKVTLSFKDNVLYINSGGDNYWDYEYTDYDYRYADDNKCSSYYDSDFVYDENNQDDDHEAGRHQIVKYIPKSPTEGCLILVFTAYGGLSYRVLHFYDLSADQVGVKTYYDFYALKEVEEFVDKCMPARPLKGKTFISEARHNSIQRMPTMPTMGLPEYLKWWDDYLSIVRQPEVKQQLETVEQLKAGLSIYADSYYAATIRQSVFLKAGYNPYTSEETLVNAFREFGINQQVRERIRGVIPESELQAVKAQLYKTWKLYEYTASYEYIDEKTITLTLKGDTLALYLDTYSSSPSTEEKEALPTTLNIAIKLPIVGLCAGLTKNDGFVVVGPLPDSLSEGGGDYLVLEYNLHNEDEIDFTFGNQYYSPQEALQSLPTYYSYSIAQGYVSQRQYDAYMALPIWENIRVEEYQELMETLEATVDYSDVDYQLKRMRTMRNLLLAKGYNPFTSLKTMAAAQEELQFEQDLAYYHTEITYYEEEYRNALQNEDEYYQRYIKKSLDYTRINMEYIQTKLEKIRTDRGGNKQSMAAVEEKLNAYKAFFNIKDSFNRVEYYVNSLTYFKEDLGYILEEGVENTETDLTYYDETFDGIISNQGQINELLQEIRTIFEEAKTKGSVIHIEKLEEEYAALQNTTQEVAALIQEIEVLFKRLKYQ